MNDTLWACCEAGNTFPEIDGDRSALGSGDVGHDRLGNHSGQLIAEIDGDDVGPYPAESLDGLFHPTGTPTASSRGGNPDITHHG